MEENAGLMKTVIWPRVPRRVDGVWYLFGDYLYGAEDPGDYGLQTGYVNYENVWNYYTDTQGVLQTGWQKIGNEWHYFDSDKPFAEIPSVQEGNWVTLENGKRYYFYYNAYLLTGWQTLEDGRYYLNADGSTYTGWLAYGGYWYYFDQMGVLQTGYIEAQENGKTVHYYVSAAGIRVTGWQKLQDGWHYFDPETGKEQQAENIGGFWYQMNGAKYYFGADSWLATGSQYINGHYYYFDSTGKMCTGLQWIAGNPYYYKEDGTQEPDSLRTAERPITRLLTESFIAAGRR